MKKDRLLRFLIACLLAAVLFAQDAGGLVWAASDGQSPGVGNAFAAPAGTFPASAGAFRPLSAAPAAFSAAAAGDVSLSFSRPLGGADGAGARTSAAVPLLAAAFAAAPEAVAAGAQPAVLAARGGALPAAARAGHSLQAAAAAAGTGFAHALAAPRYRQADAFAAASSVKGVQCVDSPVYGASHTLLNLSIDDYIDDDDPGTFDCCWPYAYEGSTFYIDLSGIEIFMQKISALNRQNISVSVVFLLQYTPGREFLIDEAARTPGYKYYAPAVSGEGAKAMRAFFSFFLWRCSQWNASVDNFILGNEINNPNDWHYSGTLDAETVAAKYAASFCDMYRLVRGTTQVSRCSISLDHNWTHSDLGRQIPGRTLLNLFAAQVEALAPGADWCVAYHLYPAILYNTAIWRHSGYNSAGPNAMFIDGANLHVLTDYIRDHFGAQHRVMLTEQGFCLYNGSEECQAAALAISYYAAKYDPLVDCFILNCAADGDARFDFSIAGHLAARVYTMLDDGSDADRAEIEQLVQATAGRPLAQLVPHYGEEPSVPAAAACAAGAG